MRGRKKPHAAAGGAAASAASHTAHDAASLTPDERLLEVLLHVSCAQPHAGDGSSSSHSSAAAAVLRNALDRLTVDVSLHGERVTCALGERATPPPPATAAVAATSVGTAGRTGGARATTAATTGTAAAATAAVATTADAAADYHATLLQRRLTVTLPLLEQLFAPSAQHTLDLYTPAPPPPQVTANATTSVATGKAEAFASGTATTAATAGVRARKTPTAPAAPPPPPPQPSSQHDDAAYRRKASRGVATGSGGGSSNSSSNNSSNKQREAAVTRGAHVAHIALPLHELLLQQTASAVCTLALRVAGAASASSACGTQGDEGDAVVCCTAVVELRCRHTPLLTPALLHAYRPVCVALVDVADVVRLVTHGGGDAGGAAATMMQGDEDKGGSSSNSSSDEENDGDVVVAEVVVRLLDCVWRVPLHIADGDSSSSSSCTEMTTTRAPRRRCRLTTPARQWRGVCFLGTRTPLDVYRRLMCSDVLQLTVCRRYAHDNGSDGGVADTKDSAVATAAMATAQRDDSAALTLGAGTLSLRTLLTHSQTSVHELVQLVPRRTGTSVVAATRTAATTTASSIAAAAATAPATTTLSPSVSPPLQRHQGRDVAVVYKHNCLTAGCMLGVAVDCYVPLPLPQHVVARDNAAVVDGDAAGDRDDDNGGKGSSEVVVATRPCFLTRAVLLLPYAAPWLPATLACLIRELCKLPAARTADDDVQLYTPPDADEHDEHDEADEKADSEAGSNAKAATTTMTAAATAPHQSHDTPRNKRHTHARTSVDDGSGGGGGGGEHGDGGGGDTVDAPATRLRTRDAAKNTGSNHGSSGSGGGSSSRSSSSDHGSSSTAAPTATAAAAEPTLTTAPAAAPPPLSAFARPFVVCTPRAISGFEVMDGAHRIICVEGPVWDVHALLTAVVHAAVAAGYTDASTHSPRRQRQQQQQQQQRQRQQDRDEMDGDDMCTVHDTAAAAAVSSSPPLSLAVLFNAELFVPQRGYASFPPLVTPPSIVSFAQQQQQQQQQQHQHHNDDSDGSNNNNNVSSNMADGTMAHTAQTAALHGAAEGDTTEAEASGTNGRIHRIRLAQALHSIAAQQSYLLHRSLSDACVRCLTRLRVLLTCTSMRDAVARDALPTAEELIALERSFGQTLDLVDLFATPHTTTTAAATTATKSATSAAAVAADATAVSVTAACAPAHASRSDGDVDEVNVTRLRVADVGRLATFDGVLCGIEASATTRQQQQRRSRAADDDNTDGDGDGDDDVQHTRASLSLRARTLARVARRFARVCYMRPCDKVRNEHHGSDSHRRRGDDAGAVLCAFADTAALPRGAARYAVEGQVVQYDEVLLLYVLATRSLAASQTHSHNVNYDALLRQRQQQQLRPFARSAVAASVHMHDTRQSHAADSSGGNSSDKSSDSNADDALDDRWLTMVTATR